MDETELARQMISGNLEAFEALMDEYRPKALRAAYLISGNFADSEDIVQETFVDCYINRKKLKNPGAFMSWFYKILSRNAWRICRRAKREQPSEEVIQEEKKTQDGISDDGILNHVVLKEEETALFEAVRKLPVKQRTVIILYYYNEMSVKEIAQVCGCMEGTVKSRLYHGKEKLKIMLEDHEKGGAPRTILS